MNFVNEFNFYQLKVLAHSGLSGIHDGDRKPAILRESGSTGSFRQDDACSDWDRHWQARCGGAHDRK